jgi:hypothetical protein
MYLIFKEVTNSMICFEDELIARVGRNLNLSPASDKNCSLKTISRSIKETFHLTGYDNFL